MAQGHVRSVRQDNFLLQTLKLHALLVLAVASKARQESLLASSVMLVRLKIKQIPQITSDKDALKTTFPWLLINRQVFGRGEVDFV